MCTSCKKAVWFHPDQETPGPYSKHVPGMQLDRSTGMSPVQRAVGFGRVERVLCVSTGRRGALTYVCGLFLSHFQLFLGIFQGLGVFVQLILSALQLLLQSHQLVLQLRDGWKVVG